MALVTSWVFVLGKQLWFFNWSLVAFNVLCTPLVSGLQPPSFLLFPSLFPLLHKLAWDSWSSCFSLQSDWNYRYHPLPGWRPPLLKRVLWAVGMTEPRPAWTEQRGTGSHFPFFWHWSSKVPVSFWGSCGIGYYWVCCQLSINLKCFKKLVSPSGSQFFEFVIKYFFFSMCLIC